MPRARSSNYDDWRENYPQKPTAAAEQKQGSGCLSGFLIPPLAVLVVSAALGILAFRQPMTAQAQVSQAPTSLVEQPDPTVIAPVYDGSGQLVNITPMAPVYDGSGQLVDPTSPSLQQSQSYDGSGQIMQQPPVTYDGAGQVVTPAQETVGIIAAEIVTQESVVYTNPVPTTTPIWNFFPGIQDAVGTALAPDNSPLVLPAGSSAKLAPFFRPEVLYWEDSIVRWSAEAGVDPNLAAVVMQIESCGDPTAVSHSGAMGLFQVMPYHFEAGENPYDPDTNALRGLGYLARSLQTGGGNPRLALAGYNGGIGVISRGEWTWAAETSRYVYFGWPIYEDAQQGFAQSAALDEWYHRYGAGLCRQASQNQ